MADGVSNSFLRLLDKSSEKLKERVDALEKAGSSALVFFFVGGGLEQAGGLVGWVFWRKSEIQNNFDTGLTKWGFVSGFRVKVQSGFGCS